MKTPTAIVLSAVIVAAVLVWHRLTAPAVPVIDPSAIEVLMKRTENLQAKVQQIITVLNVTGPSSNATWMKNNAGGPWFAWDAVWGLPEPKKPTVEELAE